jgi:hypothetical protein
MDNWLQNDALSLCGLVDMAYTKSENNKTKNEKDEPGISKEHKIRNT